MRYAFDRFVLDPEAREICDGGRPLHLEPKVFDLLLYLVQQRSRVVAREELIDKVWDGRFISDAAVSSCVSAVRKALGDDGRGQHYLKTQHGRGFRFVAPVTEFAEDRLPGAEVQTAPPAQAVSFCRSADGTRIAYAVAGQGPPLLKAGNWLNHLEYDWESPVWSPIFADLTARHRLVRYDSRGNGLSEWAIEDFTLERQVEDLEAVADAAGLDRFPLLCVSQGAAKGIVFAARHPERVERIVILGGYARGWRVRPDSGGLVMSEAAVEMIRLGWGSDNPAVRQMFANIYMPEAPPESQQWFANLQSRTTSPHNAARNLDAFGDIDVMACLEGVQAPTLVIHARRDSGVPYAEGQEIAAGIPGARFVTLDTANHLLPPTDPTLSQALRQIRDFLAE